ncbi:hypothetical protein F5Y01DRAFT_279611 [Xylaria sp. FL0043]|nr:hypothetical protein F5Y01DRAFT_279611 [Xylaria sp. FL0043]
MIGKATRVSAFLRFCVSALSTETMVVRLKIRDRPTGRTGRTDETTSGGPRLDFGPYKRPRLQRQCDTRPASRHPLLLVRV